jgi:hypothetical protein
MYSVGGGHQVVSVRSVKQHFDSLLRHTPVPGKADPLLSTTIPRSREM